MLIARWNEGDEQAFDELYRRHVTDVLRLISNKIGCSQTARELSQDIFLAIYCQREKSLEIEDFKSYLLSMAKHKIFNYYRHQLVQERYERELQRSRTFEPDPYHPVESKELFQLLSQQIERLPPKCREVFLLSRNEHLSYKMISERLSISENTVDQHIRKALRVLRSAVSQYGGAMVALLMSFIV